MESAGEIIQIEAWKSDSDRSHDADIEMLSDVLRACVCNGASVSFVLPFYQEDAKAFWTDQILPSVASGKRCVLVARAARRIVGTVQLDFETPPNQPHRAEVRKLLVLPGFRRSGVARSLMGSVEVEARKMGRSLLTLDTVTGGSAEALYRSLGYKEAGVIPGYQWNFDGSVLEPTTIMYKNLSAVSGIVCMPCIQNMHPKVAIREADEHNSEDVARVLRLTFAQYRGFYQRRPLRRPHPIRQASLKDCVKAQSGLLAMKKRRSVQQEQFTNRSNAPFAAWEFCPNGEAVELDFPC